MLKIYSIIRDKEESQILIICELEDDKDLEMIAFIVSSFCDSHFLIEYTHKEVLKFFKELIEEKEIFGKPVAFGVGQVQGEIAFFFGREDTLTTKETPAKNNR